METTPLVVFTLFIILGLYDAVAVYIRGGVKTSVSRFLERIGFKSPPFIFMMGLIMGHLFFALEPDCSEEIKKAKLEQLGE